MASAPATSWMQATGPRPGEGTLDRIVSGAQLTVGGDGLSDGGAESPLSGGGEWGPLVADLPDAPSAGDGAVHGATGRTHRVPAASFDGVILPTGRRVGGAQFKIGSRPPSEPAAPRVTDKRRGLAAGAAEQDPSKGVPWSDAVNVMKAFLGSNYLGTPFAIKMSGLGFGIPGIILIALATGYCCQALVECKHAVARNRPRVHSYGDVAYAVLGRMGRLSVEAALVMTQFGFCTVYMLFMSDNLHTLMPQYSPEAFVFVLAIAQMPLAWLRSLRSLRPFSFVANVALVFGFFLVLQRSAASALSTGFVPSATERPFRPTWPMFFGITVSGFEGIGLVIPVEASLPAPKRHYFAPLLTGTIVLVSFILLSFGTLAFGEYGDDTCGIVLLNLESGSSLVAAVKVALCVGIFFTYPCQLVPVIEVAESRILGINTQRANRDSDGDVVAEPEAEPIFGADSERPSRRSVVGRAGGPDYRGLSGGDADEVDGMRGTEKADFRERLRAACGRGAGAMARNILRAMIVALTAVAAVAVPAVGTLASLIGATGGAYLAFIMPMTLQLLLFKKHGTCRRALAVLLILFGAAGGIIGTIITIENIVDPYPLCHAMQH